MSIVFGFFILPLKYQKTRGIIKIHFISDYTLSMQVMLLISSLQYYEQPLFTYIYLNFV